MPDTHVNNFPRNLGHTNRPDVEIVFCQVHKNVIKQMYLVDNVPQLSVLHLCSVPGPPFVFFLLTNHHPPMPGILAEIREIEFCVQSDVKYSTNQPIGTGHISRQVRGLRADRSCRCWVNQTLPATTLHPLVPLSISCAYVWVFGSCMCGSWRSAIIK